MAEDNALRLQLLPDEELQVEARRVADTEVFPDSVANEKYIKGILTNCFLVHPAVTEVSVESLVYEPPAAPVFRLLYLAP